MRIWLAPCRIEQFRAALRYYTDEELADALRDLSRYIKDKDRAESVREEQARRKTARHE